MSHRVTELYNIMPIKNMPSVLSNGILSNEGATKLQHSSVAMQEIQNKRKLVQVPGGLRLHQYANLYFDARNPMMYKRKNCADNLCVLRISKNVLDISGVVITDQNASSNYVWFRPPTELGRLDFDKIYARDWRHADERAYWIHKSEKCAEVLVPKSIPIEYITGAYVVNEKAKNRLVDVCDNITITIEPDLFFGDICND